MSHLGSENAENAIALILARDPLGKLYDLRVYLCHDVGQSVIEWLSGPCR